uniref:dTMP kinase n=1 Tax=Setaria viridis TaxID=4556 RepID=A0A4U6TAF7_SETVI|nr:hypothetical protein SEVIR_8G008300v2 [Setaria viridis]
MWLAADKWGIVKAAESPAEFSVKEDNNLSLIEFELVIVVETIHLLFSANRWEKRALMESKLLGGTTLIVDRYSYSGVAFSAAKGLDIQWCKAPDVGLVAPDLKAAERGGYGGERYEKIEFQKRVADHYHSLRESTCKVVDGSLPMETVEEQLRELATNCIQECQEKPHLPI